MTTAELISDLTAYGARLVVHEGRLRVEAPASVLTPELKAALAGHKPELLALLAQAPADEPAATVEVRPPEQLTDLDRAGIEAGRHVQADGTFPAHMRPRLGADSTDALSARTIGGLEIPAGWSVDGWISRLRYMADGCVNRDRERELTAWADGLAAAKDH